MAEVKRIMISLPDNLLQEVDGLAQREQKNRSQFVREAMKMYIEERKKRLIREEMKRGYEEMAAINLRLTERCLAAENQAMENYATSLVECE